VKGTGTKEQLIAEIRANPVVQDRFNRHFHTTTPELLRMISHLHAGPLPRSGTYIVYNVHEDGVIRARAFQLQKGTAVFMDDSGTPILKLSCGNPMVAPVQPTTLNLSPGGAVASREAVTPTPVPATPLMPNMPPPTPELPPAAPVAAAAEVGHVEAGGLFFLPFPLLFFIHDHCSCCNCHQPVPEPTSLLVMGFGASCFLLRRRRKLSTV